MELLQGKQLGHRKCVEVTADNFPEAKKQAEEVLAWFDENQGNFDHAHFKDAHAIHACQVDPRENPFNFFVVSKELFEKPKKPTDDQAKLSEENYYFPSRIIFNARLHTALRTYIDTVDSIQKGTGRVVGQNKKAVGNIVRIPEACMSYKYRDAKPKDRFFYITVKYQIIEKGKLVDREEKIFGLKSHIFQHEIDHSIGVDMAHGDGEKKWGIDDHIIENGKTLEQFVAEEEAWIEKIKAKNKYAIVERVDDGMLHRLSLDEIIPEGYAEGGVQYYEENGAMKKEFIDAPIIKGEKYEQSEEDTSPSEETSKA